MYHRQLDGKGSTLAQFAVNLDFSTMQFHDFPHIGETEAEALHIMHIARMYAVELVEDFLQVLLLHTQTRIIDREIQMMFIIPCLHRDKQRLFGFTILHGIVHQIENHILEMNLIHIERRAYGRKDLRGY